MLLQCLGMLSHLYCVILNRQSLTEFRQLLKNVVSLVVHVPGHCTRFRDSFLLVCDVFEMSIIIIVC